MGGGRSVDCLFLVTWTRLIDTLRRDCAAPLFSTREEFLRVSVVRKYREERSTRFGGNG